MRKILPVAALAAAALALAACGDGKPNTKSAYLNSGASATPAMPATSTPSQPATTPSADTLAGSEQKQLQPQEGTAASTAPATPDTASPSTAPTR